MLSKLFVSSRLVFIPHLSRKSSAEWMTARAMRHKWVSSVKPGSRQLLFEIAPVILHPVTHESSFSIVFHLWSPLWRSLVSAHKLWKGGHVFGRLPSDVSCVYTTAESARLCLHARAFKLGLTWNRVVPETILPSVCASVSVWVCVLTNRRSSCVPKLL